MFLDAIIDSTQETILIFITFLGVLSQFFIIHESFMRVYVYLQLKDNKLLKEKKYYKTKKIPFITRAKRMVTFERYEQLPIKKGKIYKLLKILNYINIISKAKYYENYIDILL